MSGGLYGADIEALRSFADRVAQGGDALTNVVAVVESAMPAIDEWSGPDGEEFRAEWTDVHAVRLRETASALNEVAGKVRENADDQQETSDELSGGGGGGTGGSGGGSGGGGSEDEGGNPLATAGSDPTAQNDPNDPTSGSVHGLGPQHNNAAGYTQNEDGTWTRTDGEQADVASTSEKGDIHHTLAEGETGGFVGAEAGIDGEFGDEDGAHGSGSAGVAAGAGYDASGEVSLSENGLVAEGQVGANAGVSASAEGQVGYGDHLGAEGSVDAFAGARAEATGGVSIGPDGLGASVGGEAFAGAEASANGSATVAGVTAGAEGSVYAGVGVKANADVNVGFDNVSVDFELGAALGIGAGVSVSLDWSPADTVDAITDVGGDIVDGVGDFIGGL
ncbi:WXG100 family type VII secretion target [Myceligenerans salitolerans]|uniref:WXG100 family type VII secretion target n=1 Tax=Myceligenerans salitolerans TaxID=1230528 RepID=A0ABS3I6V9_9MICO|nr:hypothetical protein [Myceligenerans salitolerans]MBO0608737.1 hypothetical protein [Myceligenerans salitolerans]